MEITENVAFSSGGYHPDPVTLSFTSWENSPSHYSAMIEKYYTHFGYSILKDENKRTFYIVVFADVRN